MYVEWEDLEELAEFEQEGGEEDHEAEQVPKEGDRMVRKRRKCSGRGGEVEERQHFGSSAAVPGG